MKFSATRESNLLTVSSSENCDTDSWPLVSQVVFRRCPGTFDAEMGAIAAAMLFSSYCGAVAEFDEVRVGTDAAKAIRRIVPEIDEVLPVDGRQREISQGTRSIAVIEAAVAFDGSRRFGAVGRSARVITWSGDTVPPGKRDSSTYVCGEVSTNAELVAKRTGISVALGLMIGGRTVRDIYVVPPDPSEQDVFDRIAGGLELVGVKVRTL
jgi:hypothetical protein